MRELANFPRYTYNDYKNWKEDWELIDGYPIQITHFPLIKHSKTKTNLIYQLAGYFNNIQISKFSLFFH